MGKDGWGLLLRNWTVVNNPTVDHLFYTLWFFYHQHHYNYFVPSFSDLLNSTSTPNFPLPPPVPSSIPQGAGSNQVAMWCLAAWMVKPRQPSKKLQHLRASLKKCSSCKILRVQTHASDTLKNATVVCQSCRAQLDVKTKPLCLLQPTTVSSNSFGSKLSSPSPSPPSPVISPFLTGLLKAEKRQKEYLKHHQTGETSIVTDAGDCMCKISFSAAADMRSGE